MKIYIGTDHYGIELTRKIILYLKEITNFDIEMFGSKDENEKIELPDFIKPVCDRVLQSTTFWILICGTGTWVAIWANKLRWIRAALCRKEIDAQWARQKDNANVLCLSGWDTPDTELEKILKKWIETPFDNPKILKSMEIMDNWR